MSTQVTIHVLDSSNVNYSSTVYEEHLPQTAGINSGSFDNCVGGYTLLESYKDLIKMQHFMTDISKIVY